MSHSQLDIRTDELTSLSERLTLAQELRRNGVAPHDNVLDFLSNAAVAGLSTATYMIQAGLRGTTEPAIRIGYLMSILWNDIPSNRWPTPSSTLSWLDHSLITLAAFTPNIDETEHLDRIVEVALYRRAAQVDGSVPAHLERLRTIGKRFAEVAGYNSSIDARRARLPWSSIETLNSFETVAGDSAIAQLSGKSIPEHAASAFSKDRLESFVFDAPMWFQNHNTQADYSISSPIARRSENSGVTYSKKLAVNQDAGIQFEDAEPVGENSNEGQIKIWYGTDREIVEDGRDLQFLNHRSGAGSLHVGNCWVSIPESHRFGEVRTPLWDRIARRAGSGRLAVIRVDRRSRTDFVDSINQNFEGLDDQDRTVTVFVHGYNTSFEQAAIRAAQLGFDLRVGGVMALYSWPSAARASRYTQDADNIEGSESNLRDFIELIAESTTVTRVNFIVHSMGNRLVARTLKSMEEWLRQSKIQLGAVVLAAPDINVQVFRQLATVYPSLANSTTMYVSEKDKALALSYKVVWNNPRAGFTPPVTIVPGIVTVEVSDVDVSRLGHGYYAAAHALLYDIQKLLTGSFDPQLRLRLHRQTGPDGEYWRLSA